jgi:hypothetical protein
MKLMQVLGDLLGQRQGQGSLIVVNAHGVADHGTSFSKVQAKCRVALSLETKGAKYRCTGKSALGREVSATGGAAVTNQVRSDVEVESLGQVTHPIPRCGAIDGELSTRRVG